MGYRRRGYKLFDAGPAADGGQAFLTDRPRREIPARCKGDLLPGERLLKIPIRCSGCRARIEIVPCRVCALRRLLAALEPGQTPLPRPVPCARCGRPTQG